jgi:hypothetical protein
MISTFYVVQRNGIPAVWQISPEGLLRLLKRKKEFRLASDAPAGTRQQALAKLRELFPKQRPVKPSIQD